MAKRIVRPTAAQNRLIAKENAALKKSVSLAEKTLNNSFSDLASGLGGGSADFGAGMSNLTSMNPTLQNNLYMPVTLMYQNLLFMYKSHGLLQCNRDHTGYRSKSGHHYRAETYPDTLDSAIVWRFTTFTVFLVEIDQQNGILYNDAKQQKDP